MLQTLSGEPVQRVPHSADFDALVRRLGAATTGAIRDFLNGVIDRRAPDQTTGLRTFNASHLGSELSPWPEPLVQLYHHSRTFLGPQASEQEIQNRAALWFGLFVWECIMTRAEESWVFWDPNLSVTDPNRDPQGKVYFERPA